ncbi:hypothetical protein V8F33_013853 [Rhypophila sp. PSN 637]
MESPSPFDRHGSLYSHAEQDETPLEPAAGSSSRPGNCHRSYSSREYAERVSTHADTPGAGSLSPGSRFRDLANFLWQPYEEHAVSILNRHAAPAAAGTVGHNPQFVSFYTSSSLAGNDGRLREMNVNSPEDLDSLGESIMPNRDRTVLLLLQGYPSPQWLNALGGKFAIDPEFFRRHLVLTSESGRSISNHTVVPTLPSLHRDMLSLRVTTVGQLLRTHGLGDTQDRIEKLRAQTSKSMVEYIRDVGTLDCPGAVVSDTIIREFSVYGTDYFSMEHSASLCIQQVGDGWLSIVWYDIGRAPEEGHMRGPWSKKNMRTNSFEVKYLATSVHNPKAALRARRARQRSGANPATATATAMAGGAGDSSNNGGNGASLQTASLILKEYEQVMDKEMLSQGGAFYTLVPFFSFSLFSEMELIDLIDLKIRHELDHSSLMSRTEEPTLSNLLYFQQVLKRHIRHLKEPIMFLEGIANKRPWFRAPAQTTTTDTSDNNSDNNNNKLNGTASQQHETVINSLLADYHAALQRAEALNQECVQGMSIVAHNATIQESKKAMAETRNVTKLTQLAAVFVPLTFVTGIFGMNVREMGVDGSPPMWTWSVACLVACLMTLLFFLYGFAPLRQAWTSVVGLLSKVMCAWL